MLLISTMLAFATDGPDPDAWFMSRQFRDRITYTYLAPKVTHHRALQHLGWILGGVGVITAVAVNNERRPIRTAIYGATGVGLIVASPITFARYKNHIHRSSLYYTPQEF